MARLKLQVVVLALCLAGVLVAKHYVTKLVGQVSLDDQPAATVDATVDVKAPTP